MRTVKELSALTGISTRTLRWYDEIGLLKPAGYSGAGYRLYDENSLEMLQQILFFREFDLSLGEIRDILGNPELDRTRILEHQKRMLELKKIRLERLISHMNDIMKGENELDFTAFEQEDLEKMCQDLIAGLDKEQIGRLEKRYGSLEAAHDLFMDNLKQPEAQAGLARMAKWYGSKEQAMEAMSVRGSREEALKRANRIIGIYRRLYDKRNLDAGSREVRGIISELDQTIRDNTGLEDVRPMMMEMVDSCLHDPDAPKRMDGIYGEGMAEFLVRALLEFYR